MSHRPKTTIKLRGTDAALVMREDGHLEVIFPDGEEGTPVPTHIVLLLAIAQHLDCEEFCDDMIEFMQEECTHEPLQGLPH